MSKLNVLLSRLGIRMQPLQTHLTSATESASVSLTNPEDPESYKSFVARLFVGSFEAKGFKNADHDLAKNVSPPIPLQPSPHQQQPIPLHSSPPKHQPHQQQQPTKNLSTVRLMKDVAEHLNATKGHDENAFVSGFGFRWVFDRGGEEGGRKIAMAYGAAKLQPSTGNDELPPPQTSRGQTASNTARLKGSAVLPTPKVGSNFRLEKGTGEMSLAFFATANWRILHARIGDEKLFALLSSKMIFASCGYGEY